MSDCSKRLLSMQDQNKAKTFNLFVYGTLMNPAVFFSVLGRRLVLSPTDAESEDAVLARRAIFSGFKTISPDNTYLYAVPDELGRIRGYVIGPLPMEDLDALRKYEGRNYSRKRIRVATAAGMVPAIAFVGNIKQMEHSFGYAFHDDFKQEILLQEKIDAALLETEKHHLKTQESFTRRAVGELHGAKIRDLVRRHFDSGGISDYVIRHSLLDNPIPSFARISNDPAALAMSENYLAMVVRQVLFNQMEERIHRDFHHDLETLNLGKEYYDRTVSALAALRILNSSTDLIGLLVADCLTDLKFPSDPLVEFVRWAVVAADSIFSPQTVRQQLRFIRNHMGRGFIPLGAELEFSNIGHDVVRDPQAQRMTDQVYDGFVYFKDFGLDVLTWKLGGHIDDHHVKSSHGPRRGFFEAALGNISIEENLSKPVTDDPWLLNQIIHETRRFYQIAPHSVHISLQLRSSRHRPVRDKAPSLAILKCLFALGGELERNGDGKLTIKRLCGEEIVRNEPGPHMQFSHISRRHSSTIDDNYGAIRTGHHEGKYVQQFKFLRLGAKFNYELLTMALKGIQLSAGIGSFLTGQQYEEHPRLRKRFEELLEWGKSPKPLSSKDIEGFLSPVYRGLMTEKRGKPGHSEAYIAWAITQLRDLLREFNRQLEK